jgi:AcrR family transcriptional regulator
MSRTPKVQDDESTHQRLVNAAEELFQRNGYDATSVNDIVEMASLTKGSFYHYYSSKIDCLRELHDKFIESEVIRLEAVVAEATGPEDAVRRMFRSFLFGVKNYRAMQRIFDQEWRKIDSEGFEEIRVKRERILEIVTEQVQLGIDSGVFMSGSNARLIALGIVGMSGWAHRWYRSDGPLSDEEIADAWSQALLGGIIANPSRPSVNGQSSAAAEGVST